MRAWLTSVALDLLAATLVASARDTTTLLHRHGMIVHARIAFSSIAVVDTIGRGRRGPLLCTWWKVAKRSGGHG